MNTKILFFAIFSALIASCTISTNNKSTLNSLSEKEKKEGWQLLFDGKTTDMWKKFNGEEVEGWKIEDGILSNSGVGSDHGGDIITKAQFENFELSLEWKIDSVSNSGIFYLVQEGLTDAIYQSGPEYQLLDDVNCPEKLEPHQYSGANYAMHAPVNATVKPVGEWNKSRIIKNNTQVEHWLNGNKVVEYNLWDDEWYAIKANSKWKDEEEYGMANEGHIGLQDHGGLTMFRNIKIKTL